MKDNVADLRHALASSTSVNLAWLGVIGLGIILRIAQFAANRSLWLDEAALALNIAQRSFVELLQPLDYNQGAPLGFLLIQRLLVQAIGNEDNVMRLLPLTAALIALPGMYVVARLYVNRLGGLLALSLFAVCFKLTYYASEIKQYSVDVLASVALLYLAHKCLAGNVRPRHYATLALGGAAAMWLSHPALFTLVGIGAALALDLISRQGRRGLFLLALPLLIWALNLAILYFVSLSSLAANRSLIGFWRFAYMPMPPWNDLAWFSNAFTALLANPFDSGLTVGSLGIAACLLGCISLFIRDRKLALAIMLPFLATMVASGFEKYPFYSRLLLLSSDTYAFGGDGRFLLFTVPMISLLLGEGVYRLCELVARLNSRAALGLYLMTASLLLSIPTMVAVQNLRQPYMGEDIKPVMAYTRQHMSAADAVYVYYAARYAFTYYAAQYGFEQSHVIGGTAHTQEPEKYGGEIDKIKPYGRAWLIFSHECPNCPFNEEDYIVRKSELSGMLVDQFRAVGASTYLFQFDATRH